MYQNIQGTISQKWGYKFIHFQSRITLFLNCSFDIPFSSSDYLLFSNVKNNILLHKTESSRSVPYGHSAAKWHKHVMKVYSGSGCSLISEETYHALWPGESPDRLQDNAVLRQWSKTQLEVRGRIFVVMSYRGDHSIHGTGASLSG